jgi:ubiquinone/menaquinone biosynthesis C-methylase UbiE
LDWTAAQAAEWWRRTHVAGELTLRSLGGGRFAAEAREDIDKVVVELLDPDRSRTEVVLNLKAGRRVLFSRAGPIDDWAQAGHTFGDAVREYHASRDRNTSHPSVVATVRTNTDLVPKRAENLLELLRQVGGGEVSGRRVLELGCGFGALAAYIAWSAAPVELVATDIRMDLVDTAQRAAAELGLQDRLKFVTADMRQLRPAVGEEPFDVLIANNSLIYLPRAADVTQALEEFHAVLRPGGRVLLYHANKWRIREPFTNDPIVHLLPQRVAEPTARALGWRHNHGRVRLLSPLELRRRLRRAGFDDVRIVGFGRDRQQEGARRYFGTFYGISARRPD